MTFAIVIVFAVVVYFAVAGPQYQGRKEDLASNIRPMPPSNKRPEPPPPPPAPPRGW